MEETYIPTAPPTGKLRERNHTPVSQSTANISLDSGIICGKFFFFFFFWTVGRLQITNLKATDFSKKRQQVAFTACFLHIFFNTHSVKGLSFIFSYLLLCLCIYTSLRLVLRSLGVITEGFICRDRAVFQANQD